ncbi:MAG: dTMP kinase [Proteobacteria bacterium]|nr:dTMP kinase [Pseudomonadota bacterium]
MIKGKFITLEGMDGAGKSTHVAWISEKIRAKGLELVTTREPGGTVLGEVLRDLLLQQPMQPDTEAMLMFAARNEHLSQVILPALSRGAWVLSDRFSDASYAYQGGGRGMPSSRLEILEYWVQKNFEPDLTFYFDLPVEVAHSRVLKARQLDRFEQEQQDFFERVRCSYLERARNHARIQVIDAHRSIEAIRADVSNILDPFLL